MKYPNGIKFTTKETQKPINYGNRGMDLEKDLNDTNKYYLDQKIAFIYKKPTPIKITKTEYSNSGKIIKEAFFESPSTTDYNGLYQGKYIDFEAKETNNKTSFPLANIHQHQIKHIRNINDNGGICFLIVRFTKLNETYLLPSYNFLDYIDNEQKKSIPKLYFQKKGYLIKDKYMPRVDYLEIVNRIYGGAKCGNK